MISTNAGDEEYRCVEQFIRGERES